MTVRRHNVSPIAAFAGAGDAPGTRETRPTHRACPCPPLRPAGQPARQVLLARYRHYVENAPLNLLQGQDATCPHCWETINLTLDLSVPEQSYVEDCPVCCQPMLVSYTAVDGEIAEFSVEAAE
jgi:hypothetical protein